MERKSSENKFRTLDSSKASPEITAGTFYTLVVESITLPRRCPNPLSVFLLKCGGCKRKREEECGAWKYPGSLPRIIYPWLSMPLTPSRCCFVFFLFFFLLHFHLIHIAFACICPFHSRPFLNSFRSVGHSSVSFRIFRLSLRITPPFSALPV